VDDDEEELDDLEDHGAVVWHPEADGDESL
jgi:hypothetical protein